MKFIVMGLRGAFVAVCRRGVPKLAGGFFC